MKLTRRFFLSSPVVASIIAVFRPSMARTVEDAPVEDAATDINNKLVAMLASFKPRMEQIAKDWLAEEIDRQKHPDPLGRELSATLADEITIAVTALNVPVAVTHETGYMRVRRGGQFTDGWFRAIDVYTHTGHTRSPEPSINIALVMQINKGPNPFGGGPHFIKGNSQAVNVKVEAAARMTSAGIATYSSGQVTRTAAIGITL